MTRRQWLARILLAPFTLLVCLCGTRADEGSAFEGKVQVGVHSIKMEADRVYIFQVEASRFTPYLAGDISTSVTRSKAGYYEARFFPTETKTHRVVVSPHPNYDIQGGPLDYKLTYRSAISKVHLREQGELKPSDPAYSPGEKGAGRGPFKAYKVKFDAGRTYTIDMVSSKIDTYLYLEAPDGKVVAQDDDGGAGTNSRIRYRPAAAGEYRIIATTFEKSHAGPFIVTVRSFD